VRRLFGRTAKELNTLFKDHGLAAAGMQMQADRIIKPRTGASVEFARELGAPYLFVPHFDAKTADGWKRFAEQMSVAAQAFKAAGIRLGYHNHQHEFRDRLTACASGTSSIRTPRRTCASSSISDTACWPGSRRPSG
jgi:sugar phosphate isomerase/epimerase